MIATRFRSLGMAGGVALAALGCYLVSQRVAVERAQVEALDRQILMAKIDIRKLQTELGTRSRLPVLEQWNSNVLALSAPEADQYLHGEVQLARFEAPAARPPQIREVSADVTPVDEVATPRVQLASMVRPARIEPREDEIEREPVRPAPKAKPEPRREAKVERPLEVVRTTARAEARPATRKPVREAAPAQSTLRHATYVKPAEGSVEVPARRIALLDDSVLSDLQKTAQREKRGANKTR